MTYHIEYGPNIDWKKFRRLPNNVKERIRLMIEEKLTREPSLFGKPLRHPLHGLWSLRVGEYRVVYRIMENVVRIELFGHRSTIYPDTEELVG